MSSIAAWTIVNNGGRKRSYAGLKRRQIQASLAPTDIEPNKALVKQSIAGTCDWKKHRYIFSLAGLVCIRQTGARYLTAQATQLASLKQGKVAAFQMPR